MHGLLALLKQFMRGTKSAAFSHRHMAPQLVGGAPPNMVKKRVPPSLREQYFFL